MTIKSHSLVDILSFKLELDLSWIFSFDDTLCQCVDIDATQSFLLHERDDRQQTLIAPLSRKKDCSDLKFQFQVMMISGRFRNSNRTGFSSLLDVSIAHRPSVVVSSLNVRLDASISCDVHLVSQSFMPIRCDEVKIHSISQFPLSELTHKNVHEPQINIQIFSL